MRRAAGPCAGPCAARTRRCRHPAAQGSLEARRDALADEPAAWAQMRRGASVQDARRQQTMAREGRRAPKPTRLLAASKSPPSARLIPRKSTGRTQRSEAALRHPSARTSTMCAWAPLSRPRTRRQQECVCASVHARLFARHSTAYMRASSCAAGDAAQQHNASNRTVLRRFGENSIFAGLALYNDTLTDGRQRQARPREANPVLAQSDDSDAVRCVCVCTPCARACACAHTHTRICARMHASARKRAHSYIRPRARGHMQPRKRNDRFRAL